MANYNVVYVKPLDAVVSVDADSVDTAVEAAEQQFQSPTLCHHCSSKASEGDWELTLVEKPDGTVEKLA